MGLANDFFSQIDTEHKAYVLGWIATNGIIHEDNVEVRTERSQVRMLELLRSVIDKELVISEKDDEQGNRKVFLRLASPQIAKDVGQWLKTSNARLENAQLPQLENEALTWSFIRGVFDANGEISHPSQTNQLETYFWTLSNEMMKAIQEFCQIPMYLSHQASRYMLELNGNNALDFLGNLYDASTIEFASHKDKFVGWCSQIPGINGAVSCWDHRLDFRWVKVAENAVAPFKGRISDSGYDLTLIGKVKQLGQVTFFDTGIQIQPGYGWYFDLVPRSSISKTGYMLANSVGVIDRTYTGNVLVPLIKIDADMPDLELPARVVQIIPRPIVHGQWQQVENFEATQRGAGGFGSSGK